MIPVKEITEKIKEFYNHSDFIVLHAPVFRGNEKEYLLQCIDSTFVSSVGEFVDRFEVELAKYTGAGHAVVTVNGTAALHISLLLAGVKSGDEVITQPLTFVATTNAIRYLNADPLFIDVDRDTLGLSPEKLEEFLSGNAIQKDDGFTYNKLSGKKITACVPMHTFGYPLHIEQIVEVCKKYNISLVEDSAESLGSFYKDKHTGLFGQIGILSFNGNKIITTGGGGAILTNNEVIAKRAKHITTTAKLPHKWEYVHDEMGFNYRMPNINAALGVAQLEKINEFLSAKRKLALAYRDMFLPMGVGFLFEDDIRKPNYWLNTIIVKDRNERDEVLSYTNSNGVMTRPAWRLMNKLPMFAHCRASDLSNAEWLEDRVINIPSGVI